MFHFRPDDDGTLTLESVVFQALGAGSVCWDNIAGAGTFQSEHARDIGNLLIEWIKENRPTQEYPLLGLATTRELLDEVASRMEITQTTHLGRALGRVCVESMLSLDEEVLDYKTAGKVIRKKDIAYNEGERRS